MANRDAVEKALNYKMPEIGAAWTGEDRDVVCVLAGAAQDYLTLDALPRRPSGEVMSIREVAVRRMAERVEEWRKTHGQADRGADS